MTRLIAIMATAVCAVLAGATHAQEQESKAEDAPAAQAPAPEQPQAAAPMMPPFTTTPAFDQALNSTIDVCAGCHTEEDMARYEKLVGPMLAMMNPMAWTNPAAYNAMMMPMMDPNAYAHWMNAYMQKYGKFMDPSKSMMTPGMPAEPKK